MKLFNSYVTYPTADIPLVLRDAIDDTNVLTPLTVDRCFQSSFGFNTFPLSC